MEWTAPSADERRGVLLGLDQCCLLLFLGDRRDGVDRDPELGGTPGLALHAAGVVLHRRDRHEAVGVARQLHRAEAEQDRRDLGGRRAVPAELEEVGPEQRREAHADRRADDDRAEAGQVVVGPGVDDDEGDERADRGSEA